MEQVVVQLNDHSEMRVFADDGVAWELREHFAYFVPGYKFMPKFQSLQWDGKIRIFDYTRRVLPVGLLPRLMTFCEERGYELTYEESDYGSPGEHDKINPKEVMNFIKSLKLTAGGNPISPHDYQFNAVCKAIEERRLILKSPTGSGKSLIIYILLRWFQAHREDKLLIIVPTTSLVDQMYSDFDDYSTLDTEWNVKYEVHRIYSGKEKTNVSEHIYVSTWQSIFRLPKTWFEQFGTIIGDEAHNFSAQSLIKSMGKSRNAINRIGTTGTLSNSKTNQLVLEGVFGKVIPVIKTTTLQKRGILAPIEIHVLDLIWPDEVRQSFGKVNYQQEIDWLVRNEQRNKFLCNLALDLDDNTLLMFKFVQKHGKILHEMIKEKTKHRCFFVSGEVDKADREAIRHIVETQKKCTINASMGTFAEGINIKNLHNIIFGSPSKSQIKILQAIGRTLRVADNGKTARVYDCIDHLDNGSRRNYALLHGEERLRIYKREGFNVIRHKVYMK
jgi:superfamily II DNA or RNA helicase